MERLKASVIYRDGEDGNESLTSYTPSYKRNSMSYPPERLKTTPVSKLSHALKQKCLMGVSSKRIWRASRLLKEKGPVERILYKLESRP